LLGGLDVVILVALADDEILEIFEKNMQKTFSVLWDYKSDIFVTL